MDASQIYLPALREDELSQGDVIDDCPTGALMPIRVVRIWDGDGTPEAKSVIYTPPLPSTGLKRPPSPGLFKRPNGQNESTLFDTSMQRCVVLSEDCVALAKSANQSMSLRLTKSQKSAPWHVAPLRPWPTDGETVNGQPLGNYIEQNKVKRYLELPQFEADGKSIVERCYVDLRYLTPLRPQILERVTRIASMTEFGRLRLAVKVFSFFSGRVLPESFKCKKCGTEHEIGEIFQKDAPPTDAEE